MELFIENKNKFCKTIRLYRKRGKNKTDIERH